MTTYTKGQWCKHPDESNRGTGATRAYVKMYKEKWSPQGEKRPAPER